jgi:hypothetical protein
LDASHFDALAKALSSVDSRRRLLASLVTVPLLGVFRAGEEDIEAKPRKDRHDRRQNAQQGLVADKKKRKKRKKQCQPESVAQTCAGKCGSVTNTCKQVVDCGSCACDPACDACFTCQEHGSNARGTCVVDPAQQGQSCGSEGKVCQPRDGACACVPACTGQACGPDGCGGSCGSCGGGEVCTTAGQCCTPTTCAAIDQEMCQNPDDCGDYGICGTFPDGCGGTLNCGTCPHSCLACQDNICVRRPGSEVCGPDTCCINQCCFNANQGVCGIQARCANGTCCPLGFTCCDGSVNGSPRSSCYNIQTYCQGQGLLCCGAGNTCCTNEPCCTSNAQCTGGRRCIANGAPSSAGCCSFNF